MYKRLEPLHLRLVEMNMQSKHELESVTECVTVSLDGGEACVEKGLASKRVSIWFRCFNRGAIPYTGEYDENAVLQSILAFQTFLSTIKTK